MVSIAKITNECYFMQTLKDEIRNNIRESAVKEFFESGYEKASMRKIARNAGVTVSNIYNYYPDKEKLFGSIVDPVFRKVKDIFGDSVEEVGKQGFAAETLQSFIDRVVALLLELDDRQRQLLIIITEKSRGTGYEKAKEEIISILKSHLVEAVRRPDSIARVNISQRYILDIIAANYIDGLVRILKDYRSQEWAEDNLRMLLTYHLNGMKSLA